MPPSCGDQEGQALTRLYQRAAFLVKQGSGFVFADIAVKQLCGDEPHNCYEYEVAWSGLKVLLLILVYLQQGRLNEAILEPDTEL
jgi:hypothetical protein